MHLPFKFNPAAYLQNTKIGNNTHNLYKKYKKRNKDTIYQGKIRSHTTESWGRTLIFKLHFFMTKVS